MRILTGHDYYDKGLAHGADPDIVFVREKDRRETPEEFGITALRPTFDIYYKTGSIRRHYLWGPGRSFNDTLVSPTAVYVVVAGKLYQGIEINMPYGHVPESFFIWDAPTFRTEMAKRGFMLEPAERSKWAFGRAKFRMASAKLNAERIDAYFKPYTLDKKTYDRMIERRVTTAVARLSLPDYEQKNRVWHVNSDGLKTVQFYRALSAYQCWQEISMWVGGVLPRSPNPMVEVSNDIKIAKHGFDDMSFRKYPEKPR